MSYVYILKSQRNGKYYIGSTTDIKRRFKEHNRGMHLSSKRLGPFDLMFQESFDDLELARKVERSLKKLKRRDYIEKIIESGKITIRATSSSGRASDS